MTQAEELNREVESMVRKGESDAEIMTFVAKEVQKWNKAEYTRQKLNKMLEGVTA